MQNSALLPTYPPFPFPLLRGQGDRVFDDRGQAYLDFYGGHCVCSTGHGHPKVLAAIEAQARDLMFYSTAAEVPIREAAARTLADFAPEGLDRVFFCNSGAEANENALKLAVKLTGRKAFVAFRGSFHGRSLLALSVTDAPKLREGLEELLAPVDFLPFGDFEALRKADLGRAAAVIVEPIQSMAGIRSANPAWFRALREACDAAGCLLIFDEVQTGMGRMGTPFAGQFYGVRPDLMTLAKGLASGVPMGALVATEAVAARLSSGDLGSTFGGSPLACAALKATVETILEDGLMAKASAHAERLRAALAEGLGPVTAVQGEGLLLGLRAPGAAPALKAFLQARQILVGSSGDPDLLRLMPPLVLEAASMEALITALRAFPKES